LFPDVCLFVCLSVSTNGRPRQRPVLLAAAAAPATPADGAAAPRSSSKIKAGQWVTPNPTRPTILDRIC